MEAGADTDSYVGEADVDDYEADYEENEPHDDAESVGHVTDLVNVDSGDEFDETPDYDVLFDPSDEHEAGADGIIIQQEQLIGRRRPRDLEVRRTRERKRNKIDANKAIATPLQRPGLREWREPQQPERFEDFDVNSAFKAFHANNRGCGGIRGSDIKIPKTYRAAMRSKYARQWKEAMDAEMEALKDKGVLGLIPRSEMPKGSKAIKTMWVFDLKTDHLGYVVRFKARIVARGDEQRPGIDFVDTFSPVARMATFRLFVAVCVLLHLPIFQGDINTAYLNALLAIKQYLESLEGYPCETDGTVYVINRALYGLRQSGREWNTEVNSWFTVWF
ncbi:Copia type Polyprotein [Phytophthora megakarya]|uniref:Copia type Polyprotein n=1 Tax=Phytophthora megakarya TaxID=4795 RepID=A0A225VW01_9STRA|nr:Copia type Polyprotein [Phytophthora megakarya]